MPVIDALPRLDTPDGRIDLAREIIGVMFHPKSRDSRKLRHSAFAQTMLGMSDDDDEPEAVLQARTWFENAGGFSTASRTHPYAEQQQKAARQVPGIIAVGTLFSLVWSLDVHHRNKIAGGSSLNKAVALYTAFPYFVPMAPRTLWKSWEQYKAVPHFCSAFAVVFDQARRAPPSEIDERMKQGYHESLHVTLAVAAAYQQFGTSFIPRSIRNPLIDPDRAWRLRGVEPDADFLPPPLSADMLAFARDYRAPVNAAYR